jgi:hypothetical protein
MVRVGRQLPSLALGKHVAIPSLTDFLADARVLDLLLADLSWASAGNIACRAFLALRMHRVLSLDAVAPAARLQRVSQPAVQPAVNA